MKQDTAAPGAEPDYGALGRVKELMRRGEPGFMAWRRPDGRYQVIELPRRTEAEDVPAPAMG